MGEKSLAPFGELLHETWKQKRALASGISNSAIDEAYEAGCRAGALGGKLLGAGGRGFLLLFAEPDKHAAIVSTLREWPRVGIRLGTGGSRIIYQPNHRQTKDR